MGRGQECLLEQGQLIVVTFLKRMTSYLSSYYCQLLLRERYRIVLRSVTLLCSWALRHARQIISVISPRCLLFSFCSICTGGENLMVPQQGGQVMYLVCSSLHLSTPSKIHVISLPILDEGIEIIFFGTEDRVKIPYLSPWAIHSTWQCLLPMIKLQILKQKLKFGKLGLGCKSGRTLPNTHETLGSNFTVNRRKT